VTSEGKKGVNYHYKSMFTDKMKFRFGLIFIAIFLSVMALFLYLGWRHGQKIEANETTSIREDLEIMTGQLVQ